MKSANFDAQKLLFAHFCAHLDYKRRPFEFQKASIWVTKSAHEFSSVCLDRIVQWEAVGSIKHGGFSQRFQQFSHFQKALKYQDFDLYFGRLLTTFCTLLAPWSVIFIQKSAKKKHKQTNEKDPFPCYDGLPESPF